MRNDFAGTIERLSTLSPTRPLRIVAACIFVLWLAGLVWFVQPPREFFCVFPERVAHPAVMHNLAAFQLGPTLRASSFLSDKDAHHHPAFLIDGRAQPSKLEKWASAPKDKRPWVEIRWRGAKVLGSVVITHAGEFELPELTARSYTVTCLRGDGTSQRWDIAQNSAHIAEHATACRDAVGIRIDFHQYGDMVRVYEIEAWGQ